MLVLQGVLTKFLLPVNSLHSLCFHPALLFGLALTSPHMNSQIRYDSELFHFASNASHWNPLRIMGTGDLNGVRANLSCDDM